MIQQRCLSISKNQNQEDSKMQIFKIIKQINGELPSAYFKKDSTERAATPQEQALWQQQADNMESLTRIAEEQFNLSQEDRQYYEDVFRNGTDTQAKEAIAKLQSQITGQPISAASITGVNMDTLLRDTILSATPEFKAAATQFIDTNTKLSEQYGKDVSGLSQQFSQGIKDLTTNYSADLQALKSQTGTIDQAVLSRETGAALAGTSQAFAEARKGLEATIAQRGLAGSGIEATLLSNAYQQEAMAKISGQYQARQSALQISEAMRQQQAQYGQAQYAAELGSLGQGYQAEANAVQNVYGVANQAALQNYQQTQASYLQQIAAMSQGAAAGAGIYTGSQNYLAGASQSSAAGAQAAGSAAVGLAGVNAQYATDMQQANASASEGIGSLVGGLALAPATGGGSIIAKAFGL